MNQGFITGYVVHIDKVLSGSGRRRREDTTPFPVDSSVTELEFTTGDPFTDYQVRVDADLNVNGAMATVAALASTTLTTAEGSESWTHPLCCMYTWTRPLCCIACTHVLAVIAVQNNSDLLHCIYYIYICSPVS